MEEFYQLKQAYEKFFKRGDMAMVLRLKTSSGNRYFSEIKNKRVQTAWSLAGAKHYGNFWSMENDYLWLIKRGKEIEILWADVALIEELNQYQG